MRRICWGFTFNALNDYDDEGGDDDDEDDDDDDEGGDDTFIKPARQILLL